jgi:hypothetical protein
LRFRSDEHPGVGLVNQRDAFAFGRDALVCQEAFYTALQGTTIEESGQMMGQRLSSAEIPIPSGCSEITRSIRSNSSEGTVRDMITSP